MTHAQMHKHTSKELETNVTISSFVVNSEGSRFVVPAFKIHSAKIGELAVESEPLLTAITRPLRVFTDSAQLQRHLTGMEH